MHEPIVHEDGEQPECRGPPRGGEAGEQEIPDGSVVDVDDAHAGEAESGVERRQGKNNEEPQPVKVRKSTTGRSQSHALLLLCSTPLSRNPVPLEVTRWVFADP